MSDVFVISTVSLLADNKLSNGEEPQLGLHIVTPVSTEVIGE